MRLTGSNNAHGADIGLSRAPQFITAMVSIRFDPLWTRSRRHLLGVVTTVNTMVKTMSAHGLASCPELTHSKMWEQSTAYHPLGMRAIPDMQLFPIETTPLGALVDASREICPLFHGVELLLPNARPP
jgi:hypothetical protein